MIQNIIKNKVFNNVSWLIAGKIVKMIINLIVSIITVRYLGPSNHGLLSYATAYTNFFYAFCTLGINAILIKEFIDAPEKEGETLGSSILLRMASSFLSAIFILFIVFIIDKGDPLTLKVVALCCIGMIFQVMEVFDYWFQSKLKAKITAVVSLIAYALMSLYRVYLIFTGKNVEWFALATSVDYICIGVLLYWFYRKSGGEKLKFSTERAKNILSKSYNFMLSSLMFAIYAQTDKLMLKFFHGTEVVGYYSTASALSNMWYFILAAIISSMYSVIAEAHKTDKSLFRKKNKQLYAIVFYISAAISVGYMLFGRLIVVIMYGEIYLPSVTPLKILTWYATFNYLGIARDSWAACENRQKYLKYAFAAAAVVNVGLNLMFIPKWGANGAAVATLIAQLTTTMIAPFFIKGLRENSIMMVEAIRLKFD